MSPDRAIASGTGGPGTRRLGRLLRRQEAGLVIVIVLITVVVALVAGSDRLLNAGVLVNYLKDTSFVAIMAVGMTAVIISGGIDLSVGGVYALSSVVGAMVLRHYGPSGSGTAGPVLGTALGIAAAMGVAGACGLLNGLAVVLLRLHPFIITLGTMLIFRGVAFVSTKAESIGNFPSVMTGMIKTDLGLSEIGVGIGLQPVPMLVMIAVAALGTVYLSMMVAGRHVYAVGGNIEAARFSGLRTGRILVSVYVAAGLCAGVAGLVANGVYGSASSARGAGYELKVIAAAVVGGASLTGGRGTALGALLGAMLIQLIDQSIITLGINQNYNQVVIGLAIIIAVVIDRVSSRAATRRLAAIAASHEGSQAAEPADAPQGENP